LRNKLKLELHTRIQASEPTCILRLFCPWYGMRLPSEPVSLSVEQVRDLNDKLATMRHDINNNLSLVMAAAELIKHKPQMAERMLATLAEQPPKISEALSTFSTEFETRLGISRK
jgi:hypothetical protein